MNLSYFKIRGNNVKEGELWGTIDIRDVQSLCSVDPIGHRYPMEITLRTGKVILLSAVNNLERARWMQALQEKMIMWRKRRASDIPVMREKSEDFSRGICDWMAKPVPIHESEITVQKEATDELGDIDSFIDRTFNGITFNRQSLMIRKETQKEIQGHGPGFPLS